MTSIRTAPPCASTRRNGFTLLELILVLTVEIALIGITTALIVKSLDFKTQTNEGFDVARSARRLAETFRADVHAARDAAIAVDGKRLTLETVRDGKPVMIVYAIHVRPERFATDIVREVFSLSGGEEGESRETAAERKKRPLAVERFSLAEGASVRFDASPSGASAAELLAMSIWNDPDGKTSSSLPKGLDPFTRTIPATDAPDAVDPRMSGNWIVVLARKGS